MLHTLDFLEVFLPEESTIEDFRAILRELNLRTLCPNVKSLQITLGHDYCIHEMTASLSTHNYHCDPVHSVRDVITENPQCPVAVVEGCTSSFPMLLSFGFEMIACSEIFDDMSIEPFFQVHRVWMEIPALEEIKKRLVSRKYAPEPRSLDVLLCGLSIDEIGSIIENYGPNKEILENFEFCPLRPYSCVPKVSNAKSKFCS